MTTYNEVTTDYSGNHAGVPLTTYRQTAAKQIGVYLAGTVGSATSSTVVSTVWPLKSSVVSDDTWVDKALFIPSAAAAADKVRYVSAYDATTGTLSTDEAYGVTPTVGWAFELHGGPLEPYTEFNDVINTVLKRLMVVSQVTFTPSASVRRKDLTTLFGWLGDPRWIRQAGYLVSGESRELVDPFDMHPLRGTVYREADTIFFDYLTARFQGTETVYLKVIKPAYYLCRAANGSYGEQGGLTSETDQCLVDPMWVASGVLVEAYDRYSRILESMALQSLVRNRAEAVAWFDLLTRQNYEEPDDTMEPGDWWGPVPTRYGSRW